MARRRGRPLTGAIRERRRADGRIAFKARFTDQHGNQREPTVGYSPEWTRERAEEELANILADVRRGTWRPPVEPEERHNPDPTLHELASDWLRKQGIVLDERGRPVTHAEQELTPRAQEHIVWALRGHLLPALGRVRLSRLTAQRIDDYTAAKLAEGALAAAQINRTLARLAQVLDLAVAWRYLSANPARTDGRRVYVKPTSKGKSWLRFDELSDLLDAAGELDEGARRADHRHTGRRALLAVLFLAALRVGEATALCWRDIDLQNEIIRVADAKTPAGVREVPIGAMLLTELKAWRHIARDSRTGAPVFASAKTQRRGGRARDRHNVRARVLGPAVRLADRRRAERNEGPLPEITSHAGRRTAISWWLEAGHSIRRVTAWAGHENAGLTLDLYAQVDTRRPDQRIKDAMRISWLS